VLIAAMLGGDAARAERSMHDHLMAQLAALKALRAVEREAAPHNDPLGGLDHAQL
jgi:hypothetical protein